MKVNLEKMGMKNFSYFEPEKSKEAMALLAKHKSRAKILAGGTDLVPQMKRSLASPEIVINLSRITGLRQMKESAQGLNSQVVGEQLEFVAGRAQGELRRQHRHGEAGQNAIESRTTAHHGYACRTPGQPTWVLVSGRKETTCRRLSGVGQR